MSDDARDDLGDFDEPEERLFALPEAEELLPQLRIWLADAIDNRKRAATIEMEFTKVQNRILLYGGIIPAHSSLAEKRTERDEYVQTIEAALKKISDAGCLVKDLDLGLIDFPAMLEDQQVYLCWKLGEEGIGYWHRPDEGFAGRKPIDPAQREDLNGSKPN